MTRAAAQRPGCGAGPVAALPRVGPGVLCGSERRARRVRAQRAGPVRQHCGGPGPNGPAVPPDPAQDRPVLRAHRPSAAPGPRRGVTGGAGRGRAGRAGLDGRVHPEARLKLEPSLGVVAGVLPGPDPDADRAAQELEHGAHAAPQAQQHQVPDGLSGRRWGRRGRPAPPSRWSWRPGGAGPGQPPLSCPAAGRPSRQLRRWWRKRASRAMTGPWWTTRRRRAWSGPVRPRSGRRRVPAGFGGRGTRAEVRRGGVRARRGT